MKIQMAGSLAAISVVLLSLPAQSAGFDDLLRGYLNNSGGNSNNGSVQQTEQSVIRSNFDLRQNQLSSQISAGVNSGQLNSQEETELRNDLSNITNSSSNAASDGNYNPSEVQSILNEFNNISVKIQAYLTNANTVSGVGSINWNDRSWYRRNMRRSGSYLADQGQFRADIDTKQAHLDASITQAAVNGTINYNESGRFRYQLNRIAALEQGYNRDGRLSYAEARDLTNRLDTLSNNFNRQIANGNTRGRGNGNRRWF
ncbi:MAG: hypothetical protein SFV17_05170 [Candidatus Obscuribacter sp.]|nr:hypothetical protein [Candidatus Melainabacteria bacterium]MDX1986057.1 hypothetical protein [Candidatus Obscuribacter sp.]